MDLKQEDIRRICGDRVVENLPEDINMSIVYPLRNIKGRRTIGKLIIGDTTFYGHACCGKTDNFSKKIGRKIALVRACQNYWQTKKDAPSELANDDWEDKLDDVDVDSHGDYIT